MCWFVEPEHAIWEGACVGLGNGKNCISARKSLRLQECAAEFCALCLGENGGTPKLAEKNVFLVAGFKFEEFEGVPTEVMAPASARLLVPESESMHLGCQQ